MGIKIVTDVGCDLPFEYCQEHNLTVVDMGVNMEGKSYVITHDPSSPVYFDPHEFYEKIKSGVVATTTQGIVMDFIIAMEPHLINGDDILYLGFSSGISGTYNSGRLAAEELQEKYPDRKIVAVDTLSASLGEGLFIHEVLNKLAAGYDFDALAEYAKNLPQRCHHWFTVDDLNCLARGGRLSNASAFLGTMLNIKPVLHVNEEGKLVAREKVRGRKQALKALVERMAESRDIPDSSIMFSHGDCSDDEIDFMRQLIRDKVGQEVEMVNFICPLIGSHSGPGTVALFFFSTQPR